MWLYRIYINTLAAPSIELSLRAVLVSQLRVCHKHGPSEQACPHVTCIRLLTNIHAAACSPVTVNHDAPHAKLWAHAVRFCVGQRMAASLMLHTPPELCGSGQSHTTHVHCSCACKPATYLHTSVQYMAAGTMTITITTIVSPPPLQRQHVSLPFLQQWLVSYMALAGAG